MSAPPHGPLSVHPRPLLMMPSASPSSFTLPPFLPHPQTAHGHLPGRFLFPSAAGAFVSQLPPPPSVLLPSVPPFFQQYLSQSAEGPASVPTNTTAQQVCPSDRSGTRASPHYSQTLEASRSPPPLPQAESTHCSSQLDHHLGISTEQGSSADDASEHLIDVETSDLDNEEEEHDQVAFLDVRTRHRRRRKKPKLDMTDGSESSQFNKQGELTRPKNGRMVGPKNWKTPPALVNQSGKDSTTVSQIIKRVEPATRVITEDMFTSALEKHRLYFDNTPPREGGRCQSWAKRVKKINQQPSPSISDLPRLPTVICS